MEKEAHFSQRVSHQSPGQFDQAFHCYEFQEEIVSKPTEYVSLKIEVAGVTEEVTLVYAESFTQRQVIGRLNEMEVEQILIDLKHLGEEIEKAA